VFADLDVLRRLAAVYDLTDVEAFVRKWLGTLAAYDERKHTELVKDADPVPCSTAAGTRPAPAPCPCTAAR